MNAMYGTQIQLLKQMNATMTKEKSGISQCVAYLDETINYNGCECEAIRLYGIGDT